ncbi:MAG TPA: DNA polymerase III subunit delta' [Alphaproteobacteria bacterium]|nr:DNA polymerase III subunit delta' [Alphaproteobacteria bacterium]HOO50777.1 DNA polymerase III subunit delta' [Alphaproteobacteria bacterium]
MLFDEMDTEDVLFDVEEGGLFDTDDVDVSLSEEDILNARHTPELISHESVERKLLHMLENGRFPHGLIFSGPAGIGKSVMAYRLARFLFSEKDREPDMFGAPEPSTSLFVKNDHPIFSKVASGGHPDLLTIERPVDEASGRVKASVPVEEIRKIAPFMRKTASEEGGWRIVIVDDADTMTRSSQNSLLKILEEPPEKSLLVLITHRAGALLPTVYSRCIHLPFQPLSDANIQEALAGRVLATDMPLIISMAEGSLGRALNFSDEAHMSMIQDCLVHFQNWPRFQWSSIQEFADVFGNKGNDEGQRILRDFFLWLASSLVRRRSSGVGILERMEEKLGVEQRLKIYDALNAHFDLCQHGNLDKRFFIMGAFMAFEGF